MSSQSRESQHVGVKFIEVQSALALCSGGRTTGVVIESGARVTHTSVVYDGYLVPHSVKRLKLGGFNVTEEVRKQLYKGTPMHIYEANQIATNVKESLGYVAFNYTSEQAHAKVAFVPLHPQTKGYNDNYINGLSSCIFLLILKRHLLVTIAT